MGCSVTPGWRHCFICSGELSDVQINIGNDDISQNQKLVTSSKLKLLLKYLFSDGKECLETEENPIYKEITEKLNSTEISDSWNFQVCSSCIKLSEQLTEFQLQLEVIQMKILDKVGMLRKSVISNSRLFGTNERVNKYFVEFEMQLKRLEEGGLNTKRPVKESLTNVYLQRYQFLTREMTQGQMVMDTEKIENTDQYDHSSVIVKQEDTSDSDRCDDETNNDAYACTDSSDVEDIAESPSDKCVVPVKRQHATATNGLLSISSSLNDASKKQKQSKMLRRKIKVCKTRQRKRQEKIKPLDMKKRILQCKQCDFKLNDCKPFRLEQHLREHETSVKNHTCPDCSQEFTHQHFFDHHLSYYCGSVRKRKCDICKESVSRAKYKDHLKTSHNCEAIYSCEFCNESCATFPALVLHGGEHKCGRGTLFQCQLCPDSTDRFTSRHKLLGHLHKAHGYHELLKKCNEPDCTATFYYLHGLIVHRNIHKKRFVCKCCEKAFLSKAHVLQHEETMTRIKKTNPTYCHWRKRVKLLNGATNKSKRKKIKSGYVSKRSIPIELREYGCDKCEWRCVDKVDLKNHYATVHAEKKDFTCETCGFATHTLLYLTNHVKRIHEEENVRKFACTLCSKRFRTKQCKNDHERRHTNPERSFICEDCGTSFVTSGTLNRHYKIHLEGRQYTPGPRSSVRENNGNGKRKRRRKTPKTEEVLADSSASKYSSVASSSGENIDNTK